MGEKNQGKIKILLVDDHMVVVEGVKSALQGHPEFEIVGSASDGLEAVDMAKTLRPDVVLLDISIPNLNGVQATSQIKQFDNEIAVVIFTMYSDKEYIVSLFRKGISAYILKEEPMSNLILALKAVKEGGSFFSSSVRKILLGYTRELELGRGANDGFEKLSARELEVFRLLADGLTVREIADLLCISPKTVESHKYNIMGKLKVQTLSDLTKIALRRKLIRV